MTSPRRPPDRARRTGRRSRWCSTASCSTRAAPSPGGVAGGARCARAAARPRSSCVERRRAASVRRGVPLPRRAASRSSGRGRCSSPSIIRSAPAPSARGSATSCATTRRWWCPTARLSLAGGAVEPWSHPSGQVVPERAAQGGQEARAWTPTRPYAELPAEDRRGCTRAGAGSPASSGFFEEVESYRYKLHVRVFLSRYRSQSPLPAVPGRAAASRRRSPCAWAGRPSPSSATRRWRSSPRCSRPAAHRVGGRGRPARSCASCAPSSRSCCGSASATSRWRARPARCRAARPSASTSPTSSAPSSSARSTCSTSRPSGCTRGTPRGWPSSAASSPGPATRWSIVEHDRALIEAADYVIEMGPGSGERGGAMVFAGTQAEFRKDPRSLTARYLSGRETIPLPLARREGRRSLDLEGARAHNLKDVTVRDPAAHAHLRDRGVRLRASPRSCTTRSTGRWRGTSRCDFAVAGGPRRAARPPAPQGHPAHRPGADRAHPALQPGHVREGVRRDPASSSRDCPAPRPSASGPGAFSFNVPGGRCDTCEGDGFQKLEMYFVEDVYVTLPGVRGPSLPIRGAPGHLQGPGHQPGAAADGGRGGGLLRRPSRCCSAGSRCSRRSDSATCGSASPRRSCRAARPSG